MRQLRMSPEQTNAVSAWAKRQPDKPSWSEAVRRLVEIGLSGRAIQSRGPHKGASKASAMASTQIERMDDTTATKSERDSRKRRLLLGPREFVENRKDQVERKQKVK